MSNIITARFDGKTSCKTDPAYQYDYGQILYFSDLSLPTSFEVHFANAENGTSVTQIGSNNRVTIPDSVFQGSPNYYTKNIIYAWVFLHTGDSDGETEYRVTIPLTRRAEPSNDTPTPVQQSAITQAIAQLNNAVSTVEGYLGTYAPVILGETQGNPIQITNGADGTPVKSLEANINPVQDLNGYDSPWVGGAGNNLLSDVSNILTTSDVTVTFTDNALTMSGEATTSGGRNTLISSFFTLEAGTYYARLFNVDTGSGASPDIYIQKSGTIYAQFSTVGTEFTVSESGTFYIGCNRVQGLTYNYSATLGILVENSSTWTPYENICPITGRTGCNVTRTGKNLFDESDMYSGYYPPTINNLQPNSAYRTAIIDNLPKGTYTFSTTLNNPVLLRYWSDGGNHALSQAVSNFTFTTTTDGLFMMCFRNTSSTEITETFNTQVEVGSIATTYEAYNGTTYPVSWSSEAGTVYGGYVDVTTGVLTVTNKSITFNGSESWMFDTIDSNKNRVIKELNDAVTGAYTTNIKGNYISAPESATSAPDIWQGNINNNGNLLIGIPTSIASVNDWTTYLASNNLQVVYPLATPVTYHITPVEISTVLGLNNIWSDTDSINSLVYCIDTKMYIDNAIATAIASL